MREASMWIGRFTPTGVGTIALYGMVMDGVTVHPHGRGDNWTRFYLCDLTTGSPPRAWGQ